MHHPIVVVMVVPLLLSTRLFSEVRRVTNSGRELTGAFLRAFLGIGYRFQILLVNIVSDEFVVACLTEIVVVAISTLPVPEHSIHRKEAEHPITLQLGLGEKLVGGGFMRKENVCLGILVNIARLLPIESRFYIDQYAV
jgi:hypothetical protein